MNILVKTDTADIDWQAIADTLKSVGMAHFSAEKHKAAFEASYCTIFLYDEEALIGFGRALSDGAYQAALYDIAVLKNYQGKGLGKLIVEELLKRLQGFNVILYASPGKEMFYEKQGFRKMKTAMACFVHRDAMTERGFTE